MRGFLLGIIAASLALLGHAQADPLKVARGQTPSEFNNGSDAGLSGAASGIAGAGNDVLNQIAAYVDNDLDAAITLSTSIPGMEDGNGHDCWVVSRGLGDVVRKHPLVLTAKAATDIQALRLAVVAARRICDASSCQKVSLDAATFVGTLGVGIAINPLTSICTKVPNIALVAPVLSASPSTGN